MDAIERGTSDHVTSSSRGSSTGTFDRILHNFWLLMRASYSSKGTPSGSRDVCWRYFREMATLGQILRSFRLRMRTPSIRSLPVAMVFVLLYYIVNYYYSKKKARGKSFCDVISACACTERTSSNVTTSLPVTWLLVTSFSVTHTQLSESPWRPPWKVTLAMLIYYWHR